METTCGVVGVKGWGGVEGPFFMYAIEEDKNCVKDMKNKKLREKNKIKK